MPQPAPELVEGRIETRGFNVPAVEIRSLGLNVELAAMDEVEDDDGFAAAAE